MADYTITPIEATVQEQLLVPYLAERCEPSDRQVLLASGLSSLHNPLKTDEQAVRVVLSLTLTALPEIVVQMAGIRSTNLVYQAVGADEYYDLLGLNPDVALDEDRLPLPGRAHVEAAAIGSKVAVYSSFALVLFSMGKQAKEGSQASASDKRPSALIRQYTIPEDQQSIFTGRPHGPSVASLERIYFALNTYSEVRALIVRCLLGLKAGSAHAPVHLSPIFTQLRLMEEAGMTHVGAITKFVTAHPWSLRVPELEPYYREFCQDLAAFSSIPVEVRQYHRMLAPPTEYLFLTAKLRPLIAVAGDFMETIESTFKDYVYNKEKYSVLIKKVRAYMPGYDPRHALDSLASQLNLDEIPPLPTPQTVPQSSRLPTA